MSLRTLTLSLTLALSAAQGAAAVTIWAEGVHGDLSNNRLAPTLLTLSLGTNTIMGTVSGAPLDRDYFRFNVPTGASVTNINLSGYSPANLGFLAIQSGTTITVDPAAPSAATLMGYVHTSGAQIGTDILDDMGASNLLIPAAIGFVPPLGAGDYSFWLQQTSALTTTYAFDVVVVPEPSVASLLALGLGALAFSRRRR